jgi:F-type H+-transporting ATPase subunit delta
MDEKRNIVRVEITSAAPLDETSKSKLETALTSVTKKTVKATYLENAKLLGGVSVRIGDKLFDGSLRVQLEMLRHKLSTVSN